jgi:hypothetical protein
MDATWILIIVLAIGGVFVFAVLILLIVMLSKWLAGRGQD